MVKAAVLIECPDFVNEYDKLLFHVNSPRVVIDNAVCDTATVVKVDCPRKHGILLEAVQVLTDLNLSIKKAYISSDGRWLMDVYHLTDVNGEKVTDKSIINSIEESLSTIHYERSTGFDGLTALELTGTDRVGLLSEIFAVLSNLQCSVVDAKVWTHNGRVASLIYLKDFDTGSPIEDKQKIAQIEGLLRNVLKGDDHNDTKSARTAVSLGVIHTERRLHQMMFDDRDYDCRPVLNRGSDSPIVTVQNWAKRLYSVINVQCRDRTKLLFDVVCTLTDMDYIVFHATIYTSEHQAYLEFYIRHEDGTPINSEPEKQRVIQCLKAAIERRETQGIRLELCTEDRKGLLAEITRTFRENGLNVTKAEISTAAAQKTAHNSFYVTDAVGNPADLKTVESVCEKFGLSDLRVVESPSDCGEKTKEGHDKGEALLVSIGSLVKRFMRSVS